MTEASIASKELSSSSSSSSSISSIAGNQKQEVASILCIVCKKSRCYNKYRRHLQTHVANGELKADDVSKIMFQCRTTRCDIKQPHPPAMQRGYTCQYIDEGNKACGHVVLDLKRHLVTVHKLDRCCSLFEDLCEKGFKQNPLKRRLDTTNTTTTINSSSSLIDDNNPNAAPCQQKGGKQSCSHDIGNTMANVRIHSRSSHSLPLPISSTDISEADRVYQFESESDSDDCAFELADVANQAENS